MWRDEEELEEPDIRFLTGTLLVRKTYNTKTSSYENKMYKETKNIRTSDYYKTETLQS